MTTAQKTWAKTVLQANCHTEVNSAKSSSQSAIRTTLADAHILMLSFSAGCQCIC
jgi:hypothetical protein